ncbi:thymidylate synthase [Saccharibacillus sp. O16]|nr:thymidylate synthase [Saccharibacillus sp. O16]
MEIHPLLTEINTREALRRWLNANASSSSCCWLVVSLKPNPKILLYLDVVEECLCFGWIDGMKKKLPDGSFAQRISPRRPNSSWTELNKQRAKRLERLGLMQERGRCAYPREGLDFFVIDEEILHRLQEDPQTYRNFLAMPEAYRRIRIDTIQSCRKQPEQYAARLDKWIMHTRANRMYGQWQDGGRL